MARAAFEVTGRIVLDTALHVGSGRGDETTDATVVRDARGQPYIPGSSLRGVLRSNIEACAPEGLSCRGLAHSPGNCARLEEKGRLHRSAVVQARAAAAGVDVNRWIARLLAQGGQPNDETHVAKATSNDALGVLGERAGAGEADIVALLEENLCATCRLFGTVHWASPLQIADLFPRAVPGEAGAGRAPAGGLAALGGPAGLRTQVRHGVGIDRDTGAAREQIKYDFEVVGGGYAFDFELRLTVSERVQTREEADWLGLLALGLRLLESGGVPIGGRAARGVGRAHLDLERVARIPLAGPAYIAALRQATADASGRRRPKPAQEWTPVSRPGVDDWVTARLAAIEAGVS